MRLKKITKILTASLLATVLAVSVPATILAVTASETVDAQKIKYGKVSKDDQTLIRNLFDAEYYGKANPDVVTALGNDPERLATHFFLHGIFEGRTCNAGFDPAAYRACYSDLGNAFKDDIVAYYRHYLTYGITEGRKLTTIDKALEAGFAVDSFYGGKHYTPNGSPAPTPVKSEEEIQREQAEKEAQEAEQQEKENGPSEQVPTPREGYKIIKYTAPVSETINEYGTKRGERVIVRATTYIYEYDLAGNKVADKNLDGSIYKAYAYDSQGNIIKEMWNITDLDNGLYQANEYSYDIYGNITQRKTWNNGVLTEWVEYDYQYSISNGQPSVVNIYNVEIGQDAVGNYYKANVSSIGYSSFEYNTYGDLVQESFSDDTIFVWKYYSDGSVKQRSHYVGRTETDDPASFIDLVQYVYDSEGHIVKEITYKGNPLYVDTERVITFGETYVEVPE